MDCVTEVVLIVVVLLVVVVVGGGISLPKVKAATAGRLCCSDLTEISRRVSKSSKARRPHKDPTERYETREQAG